MTIICAMVLDAIFGEPKWLWSRAPHPAVMIGKVIDVLAQRLNQGGSRKGKGILLAFMLVFGGGIAGYLLSLLGPIVVIICAAILIAQKSLVQHVRAVSDALRLSLPAGRRSVAMIVGRDTKDMTSPQVARGAIESAAENFSDGVVAPLFWFCVAGLPGILIYKAINTADSMVGYKTDEFHDFGWAAARLDDVLNWIPARLSALIIAVVTGTLPHWVRIQRDAKLHRSPNAGWPETAMAIALGISLSGPRSYDGHMTDFPWVNAAGRKDIGAADIDHATAILWRAWGGGLALILTVSLFFNLPLFA